MDLCFWEVQAILPWRWNGEVGLWKKTLSIGVWLFWTLGVPIGGGRWIWAVSRLRWIEFGLKNEDCMTWPVGINGLFMEKRIGRWWTWMCWECFDVWDRSCTGGGRAWGEVHVGGRRRYGMRRVEWEGDKGRWREMNRGMGVWRTVRVRGCGREIRGWGREAGDEYWNSVWWWRWLVRVR